eukprot:Skav226882  [mRNA]  locus=scaffold1187:366846:367424:+ [translate_table: standard]
MLCAALGAAEVSGLTFLVFCVGAAAQQSLGGVSAADAVRADLAGMQGLAELHGRDSEPDRIVKAARQIFVNFFKVVLENVPQLLLQSTFFALVFDELTPLGRAKVLFSILLGLASASQKILEATRVLVRAIDGTKDECFSEDACLAWCLTHTTSACFMLALVAILWTVVKLYFVFHCETHLWNLGSGCVEWT